MSNNICPVWYKLAIHLSTPLQFLRTFVPRRIFPAIKFMYKMGLFSNTNFVGSM